MKKQINKINKLLLLKYGKPKQNKKSADPLDTLIATILSQNTTDKNSYKAYSNLKTNFKDWHEVASAKLVTIEKNIRIGGLAKQKAKSIKNILNFLKKKAGKVNLNHLKVLDEKSILDELTNFNGVGVKTASCVLLFSLKRNICPVDTHVHRVLNRVGLVQTNSADKTFEQINKNLPDGVAHSLHTNLIKLGRDICKAGKPKCFICPFLKICSYPQKNLVPTQKIESNNFLLLDNI